VSHSFVGVYSLTKPAELNGVGGEGPLSVSHSFVGFYGLTKPAELNGVGGEGPLSVSHSTRVDKGSRRGQVLLWDAQTQYADVC
jgi:hypothetical protein